VVLSLAEAGDRIGGLCPQLRVVGDLLPLTTNGPQNPAGQGAERSHTESPVHDVQPSPLPQPTAARGFCSSGLAA
jgi:hypothetical protein